MMIETRDFGSMELDENAVVEFCSPIYGFEALKRYVMLSDDEIGGGLIWLQSVERPEVCFILLDTEEVGLEYLPKIPKETLELLGMKVGEAPVLRVIAVVPEDFTKTRVNLKSPIVVNSKNRRAAQVILEADYPLRLQLFAREEGNSC
jgi:flagellar assembly factor FliW